MRGTRTSSTRHKVATSRNNSATQLWIFLSLCSQQFRKFLTVPFVKDVRVFSNFFHPPFPCHNVSVNSSRFSLHALITCFDNPATFHMSENLSFRFVMRRLWVWNELISADKTTLHVTMVPLFANTPPPFMDEW